MKIWNIIHREARSYFKKEVPNSRSIKLIDCYYNHKDSVRALKELITLIEVLESYDKHLTSRGTLFIGHDQVLFAITLAEEPSYVFSPRIENNIVITIYLTHDKHLLDLEMVGREHLWIQEENLTIYEIFDRISQIREEYGELAYEY